MTLTFMQFAATPTMKRNPVLPCVVISKEVVFEHTSKHTTHGSVSLGVR